MPERIPPPPAATARGLPLRGARPPVAVDYNQSPFVVAWEVTRACALACQHCRAEAQPRRHPGELPTSDGFLLIEEVRSLGAALLVLTGGDPMLRPDLPELIAHARSAGLNVALSPSATPRVTRARLSDCRDAGVGRVSFSLDGASAATHDAFRGVPGVFARTLRTLDLLREVGLTVQINTTVCRQNAHELAAVASLAAQYGAVMWSLFFLVPTGRGKVDDVISAEEHERVFNWLFDFATSPPFDVRTTAAPQYRRVVMQRTPSRPDGGWQVHAGFQCSSAADGITRAAQGVNDGKGFCFVSHLGEIQPSGFLPLTGGVFPRDSLVTTYREAPLFRSLRDPARLKGKCGRCEFRAVCGGSRARAHAFAGDPLAEEPRCVYDPPGALPASEVPHRVPV
ncbi:MAG: TIGR04053 family radical SAM/SPASM domain-containing protein [Actinobacteria bacterium]|nr:TIGR04053 family radical SAM/SPASM domain-containing protein [Actinomycetota bacterium]